MKTIAIVALAVSVSACGSKTTTRLQSRGSIAGRVVLADIVGLDDLSRVRVDIGRGEGGSPVDERGDFRFSDLEPDVYGLSITYVGSYDSESSQSGYQPYEVTVVLEAGNAANLGIIHLDLGLGNVEGSIESSVASDLDGTRVILRGLDQPLSRETWVVEGRYTFPAVPVGHYSLSVQEEGLAGGSCVPDVDLVYHGQIHTESRIPLEPTNFGLEPGFEQTSAIEGKRWYLAPGVTDVAINVHAPFADLQKVWLGTAAEPSSWEVFDSSHQLTGIGTGETAWHLRLKDECDFESDLITVVMVQDVDSPALTGRLNAGNPATTDAEVGLVLSATDALSGSLEMRIAWCDLDASGAEVSCDPDISQAPWTPYSAANTLSFETEGSKRVKVQVRDLSGNVSDTWMGEVRYDSAAPQGVVMHIADDATTITAARQVITITYDPVDRPTEMRISNDSGFADTTWVPFNGRFEHLFLPGDGQKFVYGDFRDAAGNATGTISATTVLDTTGTLQGTIYLTGLADHTGVEVVLLEAAGAVTFTASDGTWELPGVTAGVYTLRASFTGYRALVMSVAVTATAVTDLGELFLDAQSGRIEGRFTLQGRSSHEGVAVTLTDTPFADYTAPTGEFVMDVPPRTYNKGLVATKPGFASHTIAPIPVDVDQVTAVTGAPGQAIELVATHNDVIGSVQVFGASTHGGIAVTAVGINGELDGEGGSRTVTTEANGDYRFELLPLGEYRFSVYYLAGWEAPTVGNIDVIPADLVTVAPIVLHERFIVIDDYAEATTDPNVTLTVGASDCAKIEVSNLPTFDPGADTILFEPCQATLPWTLPSGDATKTVYARFATPAAPTSWSAAVSDSIDLDSTAVLNSFVHDPGPFGLGDSIDFSVDIAGESHPGTVQVSIDGYATFTLSDGDRDGVYTLSYTINTIQDASAAAVTVNVADSLGNLASLSGTPITITIPPLISNLRYDTDSEAGTATVSWDTDETTTGRVEYWSGTLSTQTATSGASDTSHSVTFGAGVLQQSEEYFFRVVATDLAGNSAQTSGTDSFYLVPVSPQYVAAAGGIGRVHLRWEAFQGDLAGFNIYRATASGGPYTQLNVSLYDHEALLYEDTDVVDDTTYYYVVTAVDQGGIESVESSEVSATPGPYVGPTDIQGALTEVNAWSERYSPYTMTGSVAVEAGAVLFIGPNTQVKVAAGERFIVHGRIAVVGDRGIITQDGSGNDVESDDDLAQVTWNGANWAGIWLEDDSPRGRLDLDANRYRAGHLFYRARLERASTAIRCEADSDLGFIRSHCRYNAGVRPDVSGGPIYGGLGACIHGRGSILVADSTVNSSNNGGGIYLDVTSTPGPDILSFLKIVRSELRSNASNVGGALTLRKRTRTEIEDSHFEANWAPYGAAIYTERTCADSYCGSVTVELFVRNSSFVGNGVLDVYATGTAMFLGRKHTLARISGCYFGGNGNPKGRYAIYQENRTLVEIYQSTFESNVGGAVSLTVDYGTTQYVFDSEFINNTAGGQSITQGIDLEKTHWCLGCTFVRDDSSAHPSVNDVRWLTHGTFRGAVDQGPFVRIPTGMSANVSNFFVPPSSTGPAVITYSPESEPDVSCTYSYWGPDATAEMAAQAQPGNTSAIHDYYDDVNLARVDYSNWTPSARPEVSVDVPWGTQFVAGQTGIVSGSAVDAEDGPLDPADLYWRDGSGQLLCSGASCDVSGLAVGEHTLTLVAIDSDGASGVQWLGIEIVAP